MSSQPTLSPNDACGEGGVAMANEAIVPNSLE